MTEMSLDIRYHKTSNTYIAKRRSYFENDIIIDGNLIVGASSSFWKNIIVKGTLELGKNSSVGGNIKADRVVIGSGCEIKGSIEAHDELRIFDSSTVVGNVVGNTVSIRPGCSVGQVRANVILELIGKIRVNEIEKGTKVIVRGE